MKDLIDRNERRLANIGTRIGDLAASYQGVLDEFDAIIGIYRGAQT